MFKRLATAALIAPALLLSGCAGDGTENRGLESIHQPVVSRTDYVFDVNTDYGRLGAGEAGRLAGWMGSLGLRYGDKVAIDDPMGTAPGARSEIGALVQQHGLFLAEHAPITGAAPVPGTIRVVVSRTIATVPSCPDFSRDGSTDFAANTTSNHGCAINSNLAAMVARPEDLVRGRPGAETSDPATGTRAIQALRRGAGSGGTGSTGATGAGAAGGTGGSGSSGSSGSSSGGGSGGGN